MAHESRLADVFIFSALNELERSRIAKLCVYREVSEGEVIFRQGDPPNWLLILLKGAVRIYKTSERDRTVLLRIVHAGDVFGELATFSGQCYSASAEAMCASRLLLIGHDDFMEIFRRHPSVGFEMTLDLCRRIREAQQTIHTLAVDPLERRIAGILIKLADRIGRTYGGEVEIPFRLTRRHFAEMTGVREETVIRMMGSLRKRGLVTTRKARVVVRDMNGLKTLVEDCAVGGT